MTLVKKNMTLGIILISLGVLLIILGTVFLIKNSNKIGEAIEAVKKENEIIITEKQRGDDFEKYIAQKFSKNHFTILEWTSDKYIEGMCVMSKTNPDLTLRFKMKDIEKDFSVECKYKSNYYKSGVEWCSNQQLQNYKTFATDNGIAVFVAIGIGGVATAADDLFIIPLAEISDIFLTKSFLRKYKKNKFKETNMFYDYKVGRLK